MVACGGWGRVDTADATCAVAEVFLGPAEPRQRVSMANAGRLKCRSSRNAQAVFARDVPAPGPTPTPDYGRQLDDALTNAWQPDRAGAPAGAERLAFSNMWPLVPTGSAANGQSMSGAAGAEGGPQVVSDITPDNDWRPGARYAQNREPPERGFRPLIIRDRLVEPEPGQASRLFEAETRAEFHIARVRKIDPTWRPRPSAYESVEGLIRAYESDAEQAQARLRELGAPLPPIIPKERLPTAPERNDIARTAARWLAQNRGHIIEGADWFSEYEPSVRAYLDPPKSLPELQQAISAPNRDMIFTTSSRKPRPSRMAFRN